MLQVKNSIVNTVTNADTLDVITKTSVTNCNSYNTLSPTFITSTGSNNISEDATASNLSIGIQDANLSTYYVSGTDYRIDETNAAAMAALQGQGWNGSDIAAWAYTTEIPSEGINLWKYGSSDIVDIKYFNGTEMVDVTIQLNGTVVWQV